MSPSPLPSRAAARLAAPAGALALAWTSAAAQSPSRAPADTAPRPGAAADTGAALSPDSLAARLARAEAAIALLREQLATESETAVKTRSRLRVELSARALTNAFSTAGRVNSHDVPMFVLAPADAAAAAVGGGALGVTVRQTRVGAALFVSDVLGGEFAGDADVDFFGGASAGPGDRRLFPEPRLRTLRAQLHWARTAVMVGSETPLVSDLNPVSVAAVGVPNFVTAGNLWNWLPQVRVTRELGRTGAGRAALRWRAQGAVLEPFTGTQATGEADAADAGNRSRRPYLQARLAARTAEADEAGETEVASGIEIGVGVHRGWVRASPGPLQSSRAVTADWRVGIGPAIELRGEAYAGRLVRGLGGGGVGQAFGRPAAGQALGPPVRDVAAWSQLNVQPHTTVLSGVGCGVNRADPADRPLRRANTACAAHALWRPTQPVVIGIELRHLRTRYDATRETARHVNLALGFEL